MVAVVPVMAIAGPPFFTDDPDPGEYQHWEINTSFQSTHVRGDTSGSAPLTEFNYTVLPELQIHVTPAMSFDSNSVIGNHYGVGDTEIGFKYRFINPGEHDWWPRRWQRRRVWCLEQVMSIRG
jgi:hypothetical protein